MHRPKHAPRDPNAHVVRAPGRRLLHKIPLAFVWNKVTGHHRRSPNAALNLVSYIDFLLVTTIFLLMSFSASGECKAKDVDVPHAESTEAMIDAPMVTVEHGQVLVDGATAGSTLTIEETGRMEKIDVLYKLLRAKRELWTQLQPNKTFPGTCILAIDSKTPAVVVKSVFQTAAFAGYPNVSFLVKTIPSEHQ